MKKILLILLLCCSELYSQTFPIVEEFNAATTWSYTNGAGLQNYGAAENYATFNIGTTPYPNESEITITSPVYNFTTSCSSDLTVSFPITGYIGDAEDIVSFQYLVGGVWTTSTTHNGVVSTTASLSIPNTATQFRFILNTDASEPVFFRDNLNQYSTVMGGHYTIPVDLSTQYIGGAPKAIYVYYYDITRFTIACASPLPIELISFDCAAFNNNISVYWTTATETNNDKFELLRSNDAVNYIKIATIMGSGNSTSNKTYVFNDYFPDFGPNYYRLVQVDYDGKSTTFNDTPCSYENSNDYIKVTYFDFTGRTINREEAPTGFYIKRMVNGQNVKFEKIYIK